MRDLVKEMREDFLNCTRSVDVERVEIVTESYFKHAGNAPIVQRALVLKDLLAKMTIVIRDNELIVGNHGPLKRSVPMFPEYGRSWVMQDMDDFETRKGDKFKITEEQKKRLRECYSKWEGYSMDDKVEALTPQKLKTILSYDIIKSCNYAISAPGHMNPDYGRLVNVGLSGIIEQCKSKMAEFADDRISYNTIEKRAFYQACIITCEAIIAYAERYARLAEQKAAVESDPDRKQELLQIAMNCHNVPKNPPKTYWESLQFVFFLQLMMQTEANGLAICLGRLDQTLLPFYEYSLQNGMSREDALILTSHLYLKINEIDKIKSNEAVAFLQGPAHGQCITLGGLGRDGKDATNDLSVLMLEADFHTRLVQPDIAVRVSKNSPDAFIRTIARSIKEGINKVKVFGDETVVQAMRTITDEPGDAEDYAILGCSEPVICGKTNSWGNCGQVNLAKCLELALNNGKCMLTGIQMGPQTGDMKNAACFEEVYDAFRKQVDYFYGIAADYDAIFEYCQMRYFPLPLYSIMTQDCIRDGKEFNAGGAHYNTSSPLGVGIVTASDSLEAIKTLVFDEKKLSMDTLIHALATNFEGNEVLRQMLINRAPKFGNDCDEADKMCNSILHTYLDALKPLKNNRAGGPFIGGLYYVTAYIPYGKKTAASADGRRAHEPLNDGGISPTHGMDKKGPTAIANSVGKLDNHEVLHGLVLNQKFHPTVFTGEEGFEKFTKYLRSLAEIGCFECQYNVVTVDTLRKAQKHPERYKGLVVRVAGYSAFFTQLEPELQEDIIQRTEHMSA